MKVFAFMYRQRCISREEVQVRSRSSSVDQVSVLRNSPIDSSNFPSLVVRLGSMCFRPEGCNRGVTILPSKNESCAGTIRSRAPLLTQVKQYYSKSHLRKLWLLCASTTNLYLFGDLNWCEQLSSFSVGFLLLNIPHHRQELSPSSCCILAVRGLIANVLLD